MFMQGLQSKGYEIFKLDFSHLDECHLFEANMMRLKGLYNYFFEKEKASIE